MPGAAQAPRGVLPAGSCPEMAAPPARCAPPTALSRPQRSVTPTARGGAGRGRACAGPPPGGAAEDGGGRAVAGPGAAAGPAVPPHLPRVPRGVRLPGARPLRTRVSARRRAGARGPGRGPGAGAAGPREEPRLGPRRGSGQGLRTLLCAPVAGLSRTGQGRARAALKGENESKVGGKEASVLPLSLPFSPEECGHGMAGQGTAASHRQRAG